MTDEVAAPNFQVVKVIELQQSDFDRMTHEIASTCPQCGCKLNLPDYIEMQQARNEYWRRAEIAERKVLVLEAQLRG